MKNMKWVALSCLLALICLSPAVASDEAVEVPEGYSLLAEGEAFAPGSYFVAEAEVAPQSQPEIQETEAVDFTSVLFSDRPSFLPVETHLRCGRPGDDCLFVGNAGCCSGMCELIDDFPLQAICH